MLWSIKIFLKYRLTFEEIISPFQLVFLKISFTICEIVINRTPKIIIDLGGRRFKENTSLIALNCISFGPRYLDNEVRGPAAFLQWINIKRFLCDIIKLLAKIMEHLSQ